MEGLRTNRIQVSEFKGTFEKIAAIVQVDEDEVQPLLKMIIDIFGNAESVARNEVRSAMEDHNTQITALFNPNSDIEVTKVDKILLSMEKIDKGEIDQKTLEEVLQSLFDVDDAKLEELVQEIFKDEENLPRNELRVLLTQNQENLDDLAAQNLIINDIMRQFDNLDDGQLSTQDLKESIEVVAKKQKYDDNEIKEVMELILS